MNNNNDLAGQNMSPRNSIYAKFLTKKFLVVAIFMFATAFFGLINSLTHNPISNLIQKIDGFANNEVINKFFDLSGILEPLTFFLEPIGVAVKVFSIILKIPEICLALAFLFFLLGTKLAGKEKLLAVGRILLSVFIFSQIIKPTLIFVLLLSGGIVSMSYGLPAIIGVILIIGSILYFGVLISFWTLLYMMIESVFYTINLNENVIHVYGYVQFVFWALAILGILSGFSGPFLSFVTKLFSGLVFIFIAIMFRQHKKEFGQANYKLAFDIMKNRKDYKQKVYEAFENGERVVCFKSRANGAVVEPMPVQTKTPKAENKVVEKKEVVEKSQQKKTITMTKATTSNVRQNRNTILNAMTDGKEFINSNEELELTLLKLFDEDFSKANERFENLGSTTISSSEKLPVTLTDIKLLSDSISGRKILRLQAQNKSTIGIKEVELSIFPRGDIFNSLGVLTSVKYVFTNVINNGEMCLAEYGVVVPDDTTNGVIVVNKITFEDGLYWNKGSQEYRFSSENKTSFDKELYLKLNGEN